jgi:hypothetical protein
MHDGYVSVLFVVHQPDSRSVGDSKGESLPMNQSVLGTL